MQSSINQVIKDECIIGVTTTIYPGLTANIAKGKGAIFLIRGLRNGMD